MAASPSTPQPPHRVRHAPAAAAQGWDRRRRSLAGFTLIELMIAVAILGIIAAIAFPRFNDSIRKGRRADAMSALTAVQLAQERWRGNNASFTNELTNGPTGTPPGLGLSSSTSGGFYTISLANASATGYEVTATAVSGKSQAQDGNCATLRIRVAQGNIFYGSTTAGGSTFDEAAGNRCFSR